MEPTQLKLAAKSHWIYYNYLHLTDTEKKKMSSYITYGSLSGTSFKMCHFEGFAPTLSFLHPNDFSLNLSWKVSSEISSFKEGDAYKYTHVENFKLFGCKLVQVKQEILDFSYETELFWESVAHLYKNDYQYFTEGLLWLTWAAV